MRNFVSPHTHLRSLDTGSTPEAFIKRAKELGTGYLACTDHGSLSCCRPADKLAKKAGVTLIKGIEGYFRDDDCPIIQSGGVEKIDGKLDKYNKYYHLTLHAKDFDAYQALIRITSAADLRAEQHGSERKPLMDWRMLYELGGHNITATSSCLVGMVSRHLLAGRPDLAVAYYEKVRGTFKSGNFYVELFPHVCDTYWEKGVFVKVLAPSDDPSVTPGVNQSETELRFWFGKMLRVVDAKGATHDFNAEELSRKWKSGMALVAVKNYSKWVEQAPAPILDVRAVEGFLRNECTAWAPDGDVQKTANIFLMKMAQRYGDPILVSDDSHLAVPEDKPVQDVRLLTMGDWRFASSYHMYTGQDAFAYFNGFLGVDEATFDGWVENSLAWAEQFKGFKFQDEVSLPAKFYPHDTLPHLFQLFHKHGRFDGSDAQVERVRYELQTIHYNGAVDLLPYMFMGEDLTSHYASLGKLGGPGRGSAGGLLIAYLLGITHVDPLKHDLSADRFLTADRVQQGKLPDIDMDFSDREPLIDQDNGYLKQRFGDHYAQISTETLMRLKSSIKDVHRVTDGRVSPEIEALTKKLPIPPQGIPDRDFVFGYTDSDGAWVDGIAETDANLMAYIQKYPNHWALVTKCLGLQRSLGRHASGYVVANRPIQEFIPVTTISGIRTTADTAAWVEQAGGIKVDILGVNSLKDIEVAIGLVRERSGLTFADQKIDGKLVPAIRQVPWNGSVYDVWGGLPTDDEVYRKICAKDVDKSVFQFGGDSAKQFLDLFLVNRRPVLKSIDDLAAFTALARPGPLDAVVEEGETRRNMLEEFAARAQGKKPIGSNPTLDKLLPETHGIIAFQEQLTKVFRVVGQTSGIEAENFRTHTSKKQAAEVIKDKALFMPGATKTLGAKEAQRVWDMLETFARYGFNKSHAVAYSYIGYATAWLRHNYPLEWWTAVLRNAERNEIDTRFWKYCGHLVDLPDVQHSTDRFEIQGERIRAPLSMLNGIGPTAQAELELIKPYSNVQEFCQKVAALKESRATVDPETGKKKAGRSALNIGIMTKLIVSGAADSLFPPDSGLYDKLVAYSEAFAVANRKRKPVPVDKSVLDITPLERFLLRKEVLPAYSENMLDGVARVNASLQASGNGYVYMAKKEFQGDGSRMVPVVSGRDLGLMVEDPKATNIRVAVVAYVSEVGWFWNNKAAKIAFDVDGVRFGMNKWPERGAEKSANVPKTLDKSLAILTLTRFNGPDFSVDDIVVVKEAVKFSNTPEESS